MYFRSLFFNALPFSILLLFFYPKYFSFTIGALSLNPFKLFTIALFPFLAMWVLFSQKSLRATIGVALFSSFWLLRLLSDIFGDGGSSSVQMTFRDFAYGGIYFYAALSFFDRRHVGNAAPFGSILAWAIALIALIALWEHFAQEYLARQLIGWSGLQLEGAYQRTLEVSKLRDGFFRAQVFYTHPIVLGQFAAIGLALGAVSLFRSKAGYLNFVIVALSLLVAWSTGSRSSYLSGIAVMSTFFIVTTFKTPLRTAAFVWIGILLAIYFGDQVSDVLTGLLGGRTSTEMSSSLARQQMWVNGWDAITSSPFFGFGSGQSVFLAGFYSFEQNLWTIDDMFLTMLLDYGFLGVAVFGISASLAAIFGVLTVVRQDGGVDGSVRTFSLIGLAGLLVSFKATSIPEALPWMYVFMGVLFARSSTGNVSSDASKTMQVGQY